MLSKSPIDKKQVAAIFMLAIFFFIQGIKLFHSHDHGGFEEGFSKRELVAKSNHCEICHYHFAKEATNPTSPTFSLTVQELPVYYNGYQSKTINSIGLSYSDRGPPALV